jgi:SNF2 family DNA or RNA helicase
MLIMHLRKICNHPYTIPGAEPDPETTTVKELAQASGKLALLDRLLIKPVSSRSCSHISPAHLQPAAGGGGHVAAGGGHAATKPNFALCHPFAAGVP